MLQPFKIRMTRGWHLQTLWGKQQTHTDHQKTFPWKHYPAAEESASTLQQLVPCFTMTFNLTVTLLSGERADVEVDPDRTVIFLRRAAESQLKRPLKALLSAQGRLNGPSRICDAGLQDGDVITAIVREPGPVMESYRKARAFAAIKEDTVVTWGASEFGGDSRSVRRQLTDVMQVYVSEFACAAIRNDGTVVSWGSAIAGGDSHDVRNKLIDVKEIVAANSAFAATKSDGSVVAWGDSRNGGSCEEVQKELFDVQKIFASNTAFAAIRGDGKVVTWGAKNGGGDSQAVQSQLLDVKQIHSTSVAFAAVRQDGSVVSWGAVSGGGDCSGQELTDVVQMHSTTRAFAALQADGKVVTWGAPSAGGDSRSVRDNLLDVVQLCASEAAFAAIKAGMISVSRIFWSLPLKVAGFGLSGRFCN
ncbi:unnamed protein product [Cladocopium goreaui]|uniref:Unconventional myosin-VIIb n=1 Tax=Cladocopium goreaui TaxID=2562237 RepID=A0A9P1DDV5_9DINO|nr:unnamed protein product [Cladocopium goreaui]